MRMSGGPVTSAGRSAAPRVDRLTDDGPGDLDELAALIARDPVVNAVVDARLSSLRTLEQRRFGGITYGVRDGGAGLSGAVYAGGNLLPIGGTSSQWIPLARHLAGGRRGCTSIVGRADAVHTMWQILRPAWGPGRAVRHDQPLLVLDAQPEGVDPDPRVRPVEPAETERYLPAAAAMFAEELGISPEAGGQAAAYRQRISRLVAGSRALAVIEDGDVVFKADLGAVTGRTCQVQGVWVRPDRRGEGIGTAAMAAVLAHGLTLAPTVSLYVNDFNVPARRMYETLGMRQIASLATVLF